METSCGCCAGAESLLPSATANRPGLNALAYRVGTHAAFLARMKARLSNLYLEIPAFDAHGNPTPPKIYPLRDLKTRDEGDPAIALLDAWAMVGDVLTFYQERVAGEGYLRTAIEGRSVLELARLIGYQPRPGVAASVYLAYTLDDKSEPVEIPAGAQAQSVPASGELPQSFETSEKLAARKEWNNLQPRMSKPQTITFANALTIETLYFDGTDTNLKTNDPLLFVFEKEKQVLRRVQTVTLQFRNKITQVVLQAVPAAAFDAFKLMDNLRETLRSITAGGTAVNEILQNAETLEQNMRLGSYPVNDEAKDVSSLRGNLKNLINGNGHSLPRMKPILEELDRLVDLRSTPNKVNIERTNLNSLFKSLLVSPSVQPANSLRLGRSLERLSILNLILALNCWLTFIRN